MAKIRKQDALNYHEKGRRGKIEVVPTKPYSSQHDLTLAYSPGVAEPCLEIAKNEENAYRYTIKSNLVAVITNGTAVLGLGNIGPSASKPVMEGKALLFKIFADIDVFDIELDAENPELFIQTVKALAPTFGGINLEDIKAPEAFEIEQRLKEELDIPIMHDDQHGTAIISAAGLINALEIAKKKLEKVKIVISGAGPSAIGCAKLYHSLGAKLSNIYMFDSKGLLHSGRNDLTKEKQFFATHKKGAELKTELKGADVFIGLSRGGLVSKDMVKSMAKNPIVFALANPDPEISYEDATAAREDVIMATGRSDTPNQINNVLGFPFIFRGALDVRATTINEEMKTACVFALAKLAKESVPDEVNKAYGEKNITFGREQLIPKPLDPRLIYYVAPAVAKAAMDSGVAKKPIKNWGTYIKELRKRLGSDNELMHNLTTRAQRKPKRVVFAEAEHQRTLKAAQAAYDDGVCTPILLGRVDKIKETIKEYNLEFPNVTIIDPKSETEVQTLESYGKAFFKLRERKGYTEYEAIKIMRERNFYGAMMVKMGDADAMISGMTRKYADILRPALQVVGVEDNVSRVAGMYILITKKGPIFLADTTVNFDPSAEDLADITYQVARTIKKLNITPNIALLSYSNFGSVEAPEAIKVEKAVRIIHEKYPSLTVDGGIQANFALNKDMMKDKFPFSSLVDKNVNTLIFPNLAAGNIAYKLLQEMMDVEAIGPIMIGLKKSIHVLQMGASVREIINMIKIAVIDAENK